MDIKKQANISRYVKLTSSDYMGIQEARKWFKVLMNSAPQGIMSSIEQVDENGNVSSSRMIRRNVPKKLSDGTTDYGTRVTELIVPITRDLLPDELAKIARAWQEAGESGSYQISTNPTQDQKLNQMIGDMSLSNDEYQALCLQLAKAQHEGWMRDKAAEGWSYGLTVSLSNKTHPLMRPWDDLPAQYRDINTNNPANMLNMLNNQGYAVVRQQELGSLMKILRSIC